MKRLSFAPALMAQLSQRPENIIITGGSGWLGQALLDMLDTAPGNLLDRVRVFGSSPRLLPLRSGQSIACYPLAEMSQLPGGEYFLFHLAFLTRDRVAHFSLDDYVAGCHRITQAVVDVLQQPHLKINGLLIPSSGAVYAKDGSIDQDLGRNPYGVLKYRDEMVLGDLAREMGVPCSIIRIFNISGSFVNKVRGYALSSFILDVLAGQPIEIKAPIPVYRSYVHVSSILELAMARMLAAAQSETFDTAGDVVWEVGHLAQYVAQILGRPDIRLQRPAVIDEPEDRYVGNGQRFNDLLPQFKVKKWDMAEQILETANFLSRL